VKPSARREMMVDFMLSRRERESDEVDWIIEKKSKDDNLGQ